MALVPFADTDKLPPKAAEYWGKLTVKLNIFRMLANADTMMEPALRFGGAILSRQQLGADLRELVILLVAELEGGEYEWVQHVPIGLRCGCTQGQIDALATRRLDDPAFSAKEKALLAFAAEVIEKVKASEASLAEAQKHFSAKEIVEIILTCGFYMTMARLTETTRTDIDPPAGGAVVDSLQR
ncbi:MAG: carboxymuconolactone decarboxylase family protein [Caulobacter sp.]|nr:carboxymuconolactone decarboxylase family protein [Caulobacter sp.]